MRRGRFSMDDLDLAVRCVDKLKFTDAPLNVAEETLMLQLLHQFIATQPPPRPVSAATVKEARNLALRGLYPHLKGSLRSRCRQLHQLQQEARERGGWPLSDDPQSVWLLLLASALTWRPGKNDVLSARSLERVVQG